MRKILTLMLVMGIFFTAAPAAIAFDVINVTFVNQTGKTIARMLSRPPGSEGLWKEMWSPVSANATIPHGKGFAAVMWSGAEDSKPSHLDILANSRDGSGNSEWSAVPVPDGDWEVTIYLKPNGEYSIEKW
jgi:hypothetical protein